MGLKPIMVDLFHLFNLYFGIHRQWHHEANEKLPFYLPFGKAEDTPSPCLSRRSFSEGGPRVRSKVRQLHPWRLRSGASSTFATLGFASLIFKTICFSELLAWVTGTAVFLTGMPHFRGIATLPSCPIRMTK